ncbi:hypothetical protein QF034_002470 [Streptomyces africanus]|uniref:Uncharacterized protein n=1 Tax=Streptomyces africanus TaxID=231024 RepID=A0ABU0QLH4_9ACTN|nr:hypothetical protein [Streptomyces africanus]MDQ0748239.1 hypothetical protein [Streptomyces africanus]
MHVHAYDTDTAPPDDTLIPPHPPALRLAGEEDGDDDTHIWRGID